MAMEYDISNSIGAGSVNVGWGPMIRQDSHCDECVSWASTCDIMLMSSADTKSIENFEKILMDHLKDKHPELLKKVSVAATIQRILNKQMEQFTQEAIHSQLEEKTHKLDNIE